MKKILFYILIASAALVISCNEDTSSDSTADYTDPGFTSKTVSAYKAYLIDTYSCGNTSGNPNGSGSSCQAIVFQGKVNNVKYVGLSAKSGSTFSIKIYWGASSFPENVSLNSTQFTIKITDGVTIYDIPSGSLFLTRETPTDTSCYIYRFTSALTVTNSAAGSFTINSGDYISGYIY